MTPGRKKAPHRVLFFGAYDTALDHRAVLLEEGLRRTGIKILHCHTKPRESKITEVFKLPIQYTILSTKYLALKKSYDVILVPPKIGHFDVILISLLKRIRRDRSPVVFDAFLSIYDTMVVDRRAIGRYPKPIQILLSKIFRKLDNVACSLANIVILDTRTHGEYFQEEFGVPANKIRVVYEGVNDKVFRPIKTKKFDRFTVLFYAAIRPFHGLNYILEAAKILKSKDIVFEILGEGQNYESYLRFVKRNRLKNVNMRGWVNAKTIPSWIAKSHTVLGIFGNTPKAQRVIPNKAVHTLAMGEPLITGDTPAAREIFTHRKNALLAKVADPQSIAEQIMTLYSNSSLRKTIAREGYKLFKSKLSTVKIGRQLLSVLEEALYEKEK